MAYLTFGGYHEYGYAEIDNEKEFNSFLLKASDFIDSQTRSFYQFHSLDEDNIEFRKKQFKKAVALQINHMYESGATSTYEMNTPQSWSIGRTSVSQMARNTDSSHGPQSIICDDAILALSGTGLLCRGLG